jgi:aquaporin Z
VVSKRLIAEIIGTYTLTLVVIASSSIPNFPVPTFILAGLVLGLFVYSIGNISGCHINPAVTLGLLSLKKIKPMDGLFYIIAQFIGALLALLTLSSFGLNLTPVGNLNNNIVFFTELIGTILFTFGIASIVLGKHDDSVKGLIVGGSLALGACIAVLLGGPGFLNPAVAFGAKSLAITTFFAPIIGSVIGMNLYKFLSDK